MEVLILIQHQILVTDLQEDVLQSEGRINNQILGLKGLGGNYIEAYCSKKGFPLFKVSTSEPPPPSSVPVVLTIAIPLEDDTACSPPPPYEPTEDQDTARGTCLIFSSIIFWVFWYIRLFCGKGHDLIKSKIN